MEQLITFNTAKLAKDKNFDIQTYDKCWVKTLSGKIINNANTTDCLEHNRAKQYLMQPSQSVLQKWLREKHGIDITICIRGADDYEAYIHENRNLKKQFIMELTYENHKTLYENCLEKALQEGLKLIKITGNEKTE